MKKILFLAFANCLALLGCMKDNTSPDTQDSVGSVQIHFPTLPEAALQAAAKTATSSTFRPIAIEPYTFTISIDGPGMATRTQSWDAYAISGKTLTLENIPAGPGRVFRGKLARNNMTTHEGSYTVDIGGGQSVFVPLVLRDVGNGRAEICVEVEGWPGSPNCIPIDTLPKDTLNIDGCWKLSLGTKDSLLVGDLNLVGMEGEITGSFLVPNGLRYYVTGHRQGHVWELTFETPKYMINYMQPPHPTTDYAVDTTRIWVDPPGPIYYGAPNIYVVVKSVVHRAQFDGKDSFEGSVTDSAFSIYVGDATGWETQCRPPIIDTLVDTLPRIGVDTVVYPIK